jgi:hypothetical protein
MKSSSALLHLAAAVLYLAVCCLLTFPLVESFSTAIYGYGHDNIGTLHVLWARRQWLEGAVDFHRFLYMAYPQGVDLGAPMTMYTTDALAWLAAALSSNAIVSFNLLLFFKWTMAGLAMFALLRRLLGAPIPLALAAGTFYAFSPHSIALTKSYGGGFISIGLPLTAWSFVRWRSKPTKPAAFLLLGSVIFAFGENYYVSYFTMVVALLTSLVSLISKDFRLYLASVSRTVAAALRSLKRLDKIAVGATLVGVIGMGVWLAHRLAPHIASRKFSIEEATNRSARLPYYVLPPLENTVFGRYSQDFILAHSRTLEPSEQSLYLGFTPILFIVASFLVLKLSNQRPLQTVRNVALLGVVVSIVLALGPYICLTSSLAEYAEIQTKLFVWGPAYIFYLIAPMFRFICRYHVITMFLLPIATTAAVQLLVSRTPSRWLRASLTAGFVAATSIEYLALPGNSIVYLEKIMPKAYKALASSGLDSSVIDRPSGRFAERQHYVAFQVLHHQAMHGHEQSYVNDDLSLQKVQKKYLGLGFKFVVINTRLPQTSYVPFQGGLPDASLRNFPVRVHLGHLQLVSAFDDSLLYELTDKASYSEVSTQVHTMTPPYSIDLEVSGAALPGAILRFEAISTRNASWLVRFDGADSDVLITIADEQLSTAIALPSLSLGSHRVDFVPIGSDFVGRDLDPFQPNLFLSNVSVVDASSCLGSLRKLGSCPADSASIP